MSPINIAFCINDGYTPQLAVVLTSIMKNTTRNVVAYVLSSDMSDSSKQKLNKLKLFFKKLTINFIAVSDAKLRALPRTIDYISVETYYRYLIPELLPELDKILYLDADIIVRGDITPLYDFDISDYYIAGANDLWVHDTKYKGKIGFAQNELYVNAGVLLMNLRKMRAEKMAQTLIQETTKLAGKIQYQDQDVLNIVCRGHVAEFDSIYNYTSHNIYDERAKLNSAVIIHYTGPKKPWLKDKRHPMKKIWTKYAKEYEKMAHKKLRVALLIDEFFGGAGTQFGGYRMLARNYIAKYIPCDDIKMDVLLGGRGHRFTSRKYHVDNVNLYRLPRKHWASRLFLRHKNYDVYLSIELTGDWVLRHETNKNKKLILWIQDPRPKYEWDEIATMKLMPEPNYYNQRIYDTVHGWYKNGRVRFVSQGHFLNQKAIDLYNLDKNVPIQYMPNPIEVDADFDVKNYKKKNMVIFLGRLEDVKRGWLFCETARRMPEYEFWVLGRINTNKVETANFWKKYQDIPNLHFAGHVDGARKTQFLQDAKILMNTSIHEALPVSFLEAMSYGCALVSNRNPDDLTSKFGVWTGDVLGDGFDKIDLYVNAVRELMSNEPKRKKLGLAAREYVQQIHNIPKFINDMRDVIYQEAGK